MRRVKMNRMIQWLKLRFRTPDPHNILRAMIISSMLNILVEIFLFITHMLTSHESSIGECFLKSTHSIKTILLLLTFSIIAIYKLFQERRSISRDYIAFHALICKGRNRFEVFTKNISKSGICIETAVPLNLHEIVKIKMNGEIKLGIIKWVNIKEQCYGIQIESQGQQRDVL